MPEVLQRIMKLKIIDHDFFPGDVSANRRLLEQYETFDWNDARDNMLKRNIIDYKIPTGVDKSMSARTYADHISEIEGNPHGMIHVAVG